MSATPDVGSVSRAVRSRDGGRAEKASIARAHRDRAVDHDEDDESPAPLAQSKSSPMDFVEWGPPPDMQQRELIFDSLNKIVTSQPQKSGHAGSKSGGSNSAAGKGDSRGTYTFTWGAGYHGQ